MKLSCPHCHAEHEFHQDGEQVCAACRKTFTVEGVPAYDIGANIPPQVLPDGREVTVQEEVMDRCPSVSSCVSGAVLSTTFGVALWHIVKWLESGAAALDVFAAALTDFEGAVILYGPLLFCSGAIFFLLRKHGDSCMKRHAIIGFGSLAVAFFLLLYIPDF